jgi:hypothetical protein
MGSVTAVTEPQIISKKEAIERGLPRFFTGKPCKRGHLSERWTNDPHCVECTRIRVYTDWKENESTRERYRRNDRKRSKNPKRRQAARDYSKTPQAAVARSRRHARRMATDIQYRLRHNLRNRVRRAFEKNYKSGSALALLGCSIEYLKAHLERQFTNGMSWDNMGKGGGKWNIDHTVPLSDFDLSDPEQAKIACNYKNLQPLWESDNFKKNARHPIEFAQSNGLLL